MSPCQRAELTSVHRVQCPPLLPSCLSTTKHYTVSTVCSDFTFDMDMGIFMAVSLPALHREGPICPVVPLRTPAEFPPGPQFQPGPAQRRVHGCARPQGTSQCTGEPAIPANSTSSGQANMYPVWEATLPLITSPYGIKSFVLIIFTRHWAHLPLLPSISFLVSLSSSLYTVLRLRTT